MKLKLGIFKHDRIAKTETFIRQHVECLNFDVTVVSGAPTRIGSEEPSIISSAYHYVGRLMDNTGWLDELKLQNKNYKRIIKKIKPDIILAEFGISAARMHTACRTVGVPLVVFFHGYDLYKSSMHKREKREYNEVFASAAAIICGARSMRDDLIDEGASPEKIFVCAGSGVDCDGFKPTDVRQSPPTFVHVGRFVDKKAPHLTLLAFSKVLRSNEEAELFMVGRGPLLGACKSLANALGIKQAVTFCGLYDHREIQKLFSRTRALVQHSVVAHDGDKEGTGLTPLEAGASALPVVVTNHAGFRDTIIDGVTGFKVPEYDIKNMYKYMSKLANDKSLAHEMGSNARNRVEEFFSVKKNSERLENIIRWVGKQDTEKPNLLPKWVK